MERLNSLVGSCAQLGMTFPYRNKDGIVVGELCLQTKRFRYGKIVEQPDGKKIFQGSRSQDQWLPWTEELRQQVLNSVAS